MSYIKNKEEIELIQQGGSIIGTILEDLTKLAKPGVSTLEIDIEAEKKIRAAGGLPAFKGYKPHSAAVPFPGTVCTCINEEIVHAYGRKDKILQDGDIFTMDIGMQYPSKNGFFTDTAVTIMIGEVPVETKELMRVTKESLEAGIRLCRPGKTVGDIGRAIEEYVKSQGKYGIVRDLCGHGVGHEIHETPAVLNYYESQSVAWKLEPGVVLALEPMITLGGHEIELLADQWTISTADHSLSAHYEHTVIVTSGDPIVATRRPGE